MQSAAGGTAGGREERSLGVRREPMLSSRMADGRRGREAAHATSPRAAAEPRLVGSLLGLRRGGGRHGREGDGSRHGGGLRARGALAWRATGVDARLAEDERVGTGGRPHARRRRNQRRSRGPSARSGVRGAAGVTGTKARTAATEAGCGRRERSPGVRRMPTPGSQMADRSARARGRVRDGGEIGGAAATRRFACGCAARRASQGTGRRAGAVEAACEREERARNARAACGVSRRRARRARGRRRG